MLKKVLSYSVIGLMALVLVGGTAYVFLRPDDVEAQSRGQGWRDQEQAAQHVSGNSIDPSSLGRGQGQSQGQGQNQGQGLGQGQDQSQGQGQGLGQGQDQSQGQGQGLGQGQDQSQRQGQGRGQGLGQGSEQMFAEGASVGIADWEIVQGIVAAIDHEITVQTDTGEVLVGLGKAAYLEASGFELEVGDEVLINGFDEDGEFKAGTVENLTTGQTIILRDETGHPIWAGQGTPAPGIADWEIVQGIVTAVDHEVSVQTDTDEVMVGLGKATYLEASGFELEVGDEILVHGFYEGEEFVAGTKKHKADIVAMSALLTTTASEQRKVIEMLAAQGLRDKVKVMVGGGAITEAFAESVGADGYDPTAPGAAKLARKLLGK